MTNSHSEIGDNSTRGSGQGDDLGWGGWGGVRMAERGEQRTANDISHKVREESKVG